MGFDVTNMTKNLMDGFRKLANEKGSISVNDIANRILGGQETAKLTSIFSNYANLDGNANLSEAEFEKAISTEEFLQIVKENTVRRSQHFQEAKDLSMQTDRTELPGTPRDKVVEEKGEYFANEIYDPMKDLANKALKYMQEHNGSTEGFSFTGFPIGVKLLEVSPIMHYSNVSNDTMSIKDGQYKITRHSDSAQAFVIFEYQGEKYKIFSEQSTENLQPWNNPSYTE